jgi:NADH-quinone oxidoreductase subunit N
VTTLAVTTTIAEVGSPPDFAWSTFAPELLLAAAVMVMLLLLVVERTRAALGVLLGSLVIATGVALALQDGLSPVVGGTVIAFGIAVAAIPIALAHVPRLIGTWVAGAATLAALVLTGWQATAVLFRGAGAAEVLGGTVRGVPLVTAGGSVALDGIALLTRVTVLVTVLLVLLLSSDYLRRRNIARAEFEPLVLLTAIGMTVLGAANDAITLFVALELLSIALYVLSGLARRDRHSQEAALKYFVMGAVASALLLYGLALLYVATGSLDLPVIGARLELAQTDVTIATFGMALVTIGVGFKVAAVPFQLWTPDVYQGAPTNVTALMAAGTKAAAFALLLRLYLVTFAPLADLWLPVVAVLAAGTMLYGALGALVQVDVKRILAYSSIAHAGYALIGVVSRGDDGVSSTLWYLLTYAVTTIAAFAVVIAVERQREGDVTLSTLRGLGRTSPLLAGVLTVALLSLAGIPPTAGFAGKLAVFRAGVGSGFDWLVLVGVLSSVIAAFFYLRIMGAMFLEEPEEGAVEPPLPAGLNLGMSVAVAAVVVLGVVPTVLDVAQRATTIAGALP